MWAVVTPPKIQKLAATATAIVIATAEAGKDDNPDNPFAAVVIVATKEGITTTIVVATAEEK